MAARPTIYCFLEHDPGGEVETVDLRDISYELLTEAEKLKRQMDARLVGVLVSDRPPRAEALRRLGAFPLDRVCFLRYPGNVCLMDLHALAARTLFAGDGPFLVLVGHTIAGTSIANNLASGMKIVFVSNAVEINFARNRFEVVRPVFNGQAYTKYAVDFESPVLIAVKPGAIGYLKKIGCGATVRDMAEYDLSPGGDDAVRDVRLVKGNPGDIDLAEADLVVGIGKGVVESGCLDQVLAFADSIKATFGCTRPLVDAGLFPLGRQIGITGRIISPRLYVALGISGTDHHTRGVLGAENIIAVNSDRNAPILKLADVGFVGDLRDILPSVAGKVHAMRTAGHA